AGLAAVVVVLTGFRAFIAGGGGHNAPSDFLQAHINVVQVLQVPLLAGLARLFFGRSRNFAEQLVLASYTAGLRIAFLAIVVLPAWYLLRPGASFGTPLTLIYMALWCAYFAWASARFNEGRLWLGLLKGAAAAAATQFLTAQALSLVGRIWLKF